jgi:RND family efflux transporter MFP subunit
MTVKLSSWLVIALASGIAIQAQAEPLGCLIEPDRVADVGSASVGVLEEVKVERGDFVVAGQVLARLSTGVERASVAVAESRARADAEVKAAEAAADLARNKLERARDLIKAKFISSQALEQAQAEARVADQRAQQARDARDVAQREFQLSTAQLGQRFIRAPFEGIVVERYRTAGERIEREPVVKIARIDPLRIEAIAPAALFGTIQSGQVGRVSPQLQQFGTLSATVTVVDRVVDAASNSFRVRLTMPNPEHRIPSGLRCSVDFSARPAAAPPAAAVRR